MVEPTKSVSAVDASVTAEQIAEPSINGGPPKSAPKGKVLEVARKKSQKHHTMCRWGTIDLGSFELLSDHGDAVEEDVEIDEFSEERPGMMPPLPPASWFKKAGIFKSYRDVLWEISETLH